MLDLCIFSHGEATPLGLTPIGHEQSRLAVARWMRVWDCKPVVAFNVPSAPARDAAKKFTAECGIQSIECGLLSHAHFHSYWKHEQFAKMLEKREESHVLIFGHEETRRVCDIIVTKVFGKAEMNLPLPIGGVLRFSPSKGYELL